MYILHKLLQYYYFVVIFSIFYTHHRYHKKGNKKIGTNLNINTVQYCLGMADFFNFSRIKPLLSISLLQTL